MRTDRLLSLDREETREKLYSNLNALGFLVDGPEDAGPWAALKEFGPKGLAPASRWEERDVEVAALPIDEREAMNPALLAEKLGAYGFLVVHAETVAVVEMDYLHDLGTGFKGAFPSRSVSRTRIVLREFRPRP